MSEPRSLYLGASEGRLLNGGPRPPDPLELPLIGEEWPSTFQRDCSVALRCHRCKRCAIVCASIQDILSYTLFLTEGTNLSAIEVLKNYCPTNENSNIGSDDHSYWWTAINQTSRAIEPAMDVALVLQHSLNSTLGKHHRKHEHEIARMSTGC